MKSKSKLPHHVIIGENAIKKLPSFLKKRKSKKVFIISDERLIEERKNIVKLLSSHDFIVFELAVTAGEDLKKIDSIYPLYGSLITAKADRDSVIIAFGGGSVGDVAGFVASTYMRGIDWISIPTTLLGQVDSGIGGKTGINHALGKNLIGSFHQPKMVICDTFFLKTLGKRELISGIGEIVKYAIALDYSFYKYLEKNIDYLLKFDQKVLQYCIKRSVYWKCKLVAKDELDRKGVREKLNFGHTFAHALESSTNYQSYQHGEAVIWGMRFVVALSEYCGFLTSKNSLRIDLLLKKLSVPKLPTQFKEQLIFDHMKKDKKAEGNIIRFVMLKTIGETISYSKIDKKDLHAAYRKISWTE